MSEGPMRPEQLPSDLKLEGDLKWVRGEEKAHGGVPAEERKGPDIVRARLEAAGVQFYSGLNEDLDRAIHSTFDKVGGKGEWKKIRDRLREHGVDVDSVAKLRKSYRSAGGETEEVKGERPERADIWKLPGGVQLQRFLAISDDRIRQTLITGWMGTYGDTDPILWDRAVAGLEPVATGETAPGTTRQPEEQVAPRAEIKDSIPNAENELRLFLRRKVLAKLDEITNVDLLTVDGVLGLVVKDLTQEAETMIVSIFPGWLGERRDEVEKAVRGEVGVLCNLRAAEIREESYQETHPKNVAANFIRDFEGTADVKSNAVDIMNTTLEALRKLPDLGPTALTTEKIDKALSILLWMGMGDETTGTEPDWVRPFLGFRGVVNEHGKVENFHNPKYPYEIKERCLEEITRVYGEDARDIALKLFNGLRMGSRFNNLHYFAQFVQYSDNRHFMTTVLEAPVGSDRVYVDPKEVETGHQSHKDEIKSIAFTPLEIKVEERGRKTQGVYFERALKGEFLRATNFRSREKSIDRSYVPVVKNANKFRTAVIEIGNLGDKTNEKSGKVDGAVDQLISIATAGRELIDLGAISLDELRRQLMVEAKNIIWEFSVRNEVNMPPGQKKESVKFLLPSGYNKLLTLMSRATLEGVSKWADGSQFIIMGDDDLAELSEYAEKFRKAALGKFKGLETDDYSKTSVLESDENKAVGLRLPRIRGEEAQPMVVAKVSERLQKIARQADQFGRSIWGEKYFKNRE